MFNVDDAVLRQRLVRRATWRESGNDLFATSQQQFNQWVKQSEEQPPIYRVNTTLTPIDECVNRATAWIQKHV